MTTSEFVQMWICIILLMGIALMIGYSIGLKDGQREGYLRGRAVSRHLSAKENER
jgi:hypothetical protein